MAVRIEDAGFEIRDMIAWVYGSGFPKSLDVSKAIDKAAGVEREVVGVADVGPDMRGGNFENAAGRMVANITAPATDAAKEWQGWGTALKPALEPITVARKPLIGTVAANVLAHGTGGLNVNGCRVGTEPGELTPRNNKPGPNGWKNSSGGYIEPSPLGRWPANLIHDGSEEVVGLFPVTEASKQADRGAGKGETGCYGVFGGEPGVRGHNDNGGSAARFFYTAKADKSDRGPGNNHPTVKPVDLMRYLVRLVCPIGGVVLDPFSGSGTTLAAAQAEGCLAIGVEREAAYCEIIKGRFHQRRLF
jgi:site-specific DNA-methyltransferase (adenine-specific)